MRDEAAAIEVECPRCKETLIVYIPQEEIPKCPKCKTQMVIKELLDEGKSY
jgi:ribosomal protein S27E